MLGQDHPDHVRAPLGMLLTECLGLDDKVLGGAWAGRGAVIDRRRRLALVVGTEAHEVINGAQGEMAALRQQSGGQSALVAVEDRLANRQGNGVWHGRTLQEKTRGPT